MSFFLLDTLLSSPPAHQPAYARRTLPQPQPQAQTKRPDNSVSRTQQSALKVRIVDQTDSFLLLCEAPGIYEEDLHITLASNTLTVRAQPSGKSRFAELLNLDRGFQRSFQIPKDVIDTDRITANLDHGILAVHLPKAPLRKPRVLNIAVQSAPTKPITAPPAREGPSTPPSGPSVAPTAVEYVNNAATDDHQEMPPLQPADTSEADADVGTSLTQKNLEDHTDKTADDAENHGPDEEDEQDGSVEDCEY